MIALTLTRKSYSMPTFTCLVIIERFKKYQRPDEGPKYPKYKQTNDGLLEKLREIMETN